MIFEMGTLYESEYTFQNFGQQVLAKKLFFWYILVKNTLKTAKMDERGEGVGGFCVVVFGVFIFGWKKAQRVCSTRVKPKLIYFFIARFFRKEKKKRPKIERLNIKTIRFDKKKWKDHLVLHYLISKWIFFLITFRRHQDLQIFISPKSLILQRKKTLPNDARIQKRLKRLGFCRKV